MMVGFTNVGKNLAHLERLPGLNVGVPSRDTIRPGIACPLPQKFRILGGPSEKTHKQAQRDFPHRSYINLAFPPGARYH